MDKPNEATQCFATFLVDLSHGEINAKLSEKLAQVTKAVNDTQKPGQLTLKITVKPEGTMAMTHCEVTTKIPEPSMPGTMFFFGDEGSLHREDPRQLSLREIVTPSQPLRTVGAQDDE